MLKLGFCITGSFCSMDDMLDVLNDLKDLYDIEIFVSPTVLKNDSRFYKSDELFTKIKNVIDCPIHSTINESEVFGPLKKLDIVLIYPCTSNTLAKLAQGINDNCITMIVKSSLRNNVSIVVGVYTNDALGNSGKNIMCLLNSKNYYFVPMFQDHYKKKPLSMIADKNKVIGTLNKAYQKEQIQPLILGYKEV
ncbi:MAG: dipicolinate synthase subunit B [Bacilli bacterium]|nr:dipicolinate synthase subunit B [Bacilli bacterium]